MYKTITKDDLIKVGITVDENDIIYVKGKPKTKFDEIGQKHPYSGKDKLYDYVSVYQGCWTDYRHKKHQEYFLCAAHRIIWAWHKGVCPGNLTIDHLDNNPHNNKFENLEAVTLSENLKRKACTNNQYTVGMTKEELLKRREERLALATKKNDVQKQIVEHLDAIKKLKKEWHELCKM